MGWLLLNSRSAKYRQPDRSHRGLRSIRNTSILASKRKSDIISQTRKRE